MGRARLCQIDAREDVHRQTLRRANEPRDVASEPDARVLTHSLWLSIGLHAGWIFGSGAFSRLARQQTLAFPWIGKNLLVGIIPLGLAVLTWIIMRTWLKYDRASQV